MHLGRKRVEFIDLSIFGDLELPGRTKTIALANTIAAVSTQRVVIEATV
jgi:hypothetical protein